MGAQVRKCPRRGGRGGRGGKGGERGGRGRRGGGEGWERGGGEGGGRGGRGGEREGNLVSLVRNRDGFHAPFTKKTNLCQKVEYGGPRFSSSLFGEGFSFQVFGEGRRVSVFWEAFPLRVSKGHVCLGLGQPFSLPPNFSKPRSAWFQQALSAPGCPVDSTD